MSANNLSAGIYRLTVSVKRAVTPALIAAIVVLALSYPATAGDSEEAREELRRLLVAYSPQEFVSRALSGDAAVVGLFLAAGMDPEETNEFARPP